MELRTKGKWIINKYNTIVDESGKTIRCFGFSHSMSGSGEEEANASYIVKAVNNFNAMKDLLSEYVKMQNDSTYGDVVWRLAVTEKATKLLQKINEIK